MNYQQLIQYILRRSHETLWANLPPQTRLSDAKAVAIIRELVSSPTARKAIERGSDTLCAFALRALNRIVCETSRPPADIITRLWDVVDEPQLKGVLGIRKNPSPNLSIKKPPA
jgi:hypothetical protein